jgi:hypothetical protein
MKKFIFLLLLGLAQPTRAATIAPSHLTDQLSYNIAQPNSTADVTTNVNDVIRVPRSSRQLALEKP